MRSSIPHPQQEHALARFSLRGKEQAVYITERFLQGAQTKRWPTGNAAQNKAAEKKH
jgi:hypothetical protein